MPLAQPAALSNLHHPKMHFQDPMPDVHLPERAAHPPTSIKFHIPRRLLQEFHRPRFLQNELSIHKNKPEFSVPQKKRCIDHRQDNNRPRQPRNILDPKNPNRNFEPQIQVIAKHDRSFKSLYQNFY